MFRFLQGATAIVSSIAFIFPTQLPSYPFSPSASGSFASLLDRYQFATDLWGNENPVPAETGMSVAVSDDGSVIVAGSPYDSSIPDPNHQFAGSGSGAAYVYVRPATGWDGVKKATAVLTASNAQSMERVGFAVAISGDGRTVAAASPFRVGSGVSKPQGVIYVFERPLSGWTSTTEKTMLLATSSNSSAEVGASVAVNRDGSVIAAGAPGRYAMENGQNTKEGAVYVFDRPSNGWPITTTQSSILTAKDGAVGDRVGTSVAMSRDGGTIVAGAPSKHFTDRPEDSGPGAAYLFSRPAGGWNALDISSTRLDPSDPLASDYFGLACTISGDGRTVVIGSRALAPNTAGRAGASYLYVQPAGGWPAEATQTAYLQPTDSSPQDDFGHALASSGDGRTILISAPRRNAAYVFSLNGDTWPSMVGEELKISTPDNQSDEQFGLAVALDLNGATIAIGIPNFNVENENTNGNEGKTQVYEARRFTMYAPEIANFH
jgi:hypothetical protein